MPHWTLDSIAWDRFDPAKVDVQVVKAVKAAALVEYNSGDYVAYLRNVFTDDPDFLAAAEIWGAEERQHGLALAKWAKLADPAFDFDAAFARFTAGYQLPLDADASVRGSRTGELIARCVVESGTSSYYTAIRDGTAEPVLKQIAANIAADEFRHYRLFYDHLQRYRATERPSLWRRLKVMAGRIVEAEDDELAFAYHSANTAPGTPYDRKANATAYERTAMAFYRRKHIEKLVAMALKAAGLKPNGWIGGIGKALAWRLLSLRLRMAG